MVLKLISFIFVISLAFGIPTSNKVKDVPFDVNKVINQVSPHHSQPPNPQYLTSDLTGEFLIDTSIIYVPAPYDQFYPSVAFDGTNYLVVWEDLGTDDIYGARVSQIGVVLDLGGIAISTATSSQGSPTVSFDGTNYFVVWNDCRGGNLDIYGTRVSLNGEVLDPAGIAVSTAGYDQYSPSVAFDGTNYFVVWEDFRGSSHDIYGARVNLSGTVLDPNGIPISTAINHQELPSVAFDGTNYLVVWSDFRNGSSNIYCARVNSSGVILDPDGILTAAHSQYSSVAFDGTNYLVVWQDRRSGFFDIYGARVSPACIVLDPTGIALSTADNIQSVPSLAFDGTNYLIVWQDNRNNDTSHIYGARISQSGIVLDPTGIAISTGNAQSSPSVAFDGNNYFVVWEDLGNEDIYGTRVNRSGIVLDPNGIAISSARLDQYSPSVAFDGTNYLVVWQDRRSGSFDIYGTRVSPAGVVLDTNGFPISILTNDQDSPALVFDGTNYIVVWQNRISGNKFDIYGARVNLLGSVIDSFPISTQEGDQYLPRLAHGSGNQVLITYSGWVDSVNHHPANNYRIWGKFSSDIGIAEQNPKVKMQSTKLLEVYPNPARSYCAIRLPYTTDRQMIKIFDVSGKLAKKEKVTSAQSHKQELRISLKGINPGIYFLQLETEIRKFLIVR